MSSARSRYVADYLRTSFWFIPALMTVGAWILAVITLEIDAVVSLPGRDVPEVLYAGGPDGAREVLGTIASSEITVAGTVFSITVVALTLASSQFGPRMLANFVRDRINQASLGIFVAGFLYCLLVLRVITSNVHETPNVSVNVAIVIAVISLGNLIFFIHHISTTIQAPNLVATIAAELSGHADRIFPHAAELTQARLSDDEPPEPDDDEDSEHIQANASGFVQLIDLERLVKIAHQHDLLIRLEARPGRFAIQHTPIATVWPAVEDDVEREIADCVKAGSRRKPIHDFEFPLRQLTEVAVRALSPAINDPFTAAASVNHLGAILCRIASERLPSSVIADSTGRVRVYLARPMTFEGLVGIAFNQVRQMASDHVTVYITLLESLTRVVTCVSARDQLDVLRKQAQLVLERAKAVLPEPEDIAAVQDRYDKFVEEAEHEHRFDGIATT